MKYRIEFVPRYGTTIGIVWKLNDSEINDEYGIDTNIKEETIGHIRISNEEEQGLWKIVIQKLNESLVEE